MFQNYEFLRNSVKKSFFPRDFEGANSLKICEKNNSQGIVFTKRNSCQRALSQALSHDFKHKLMF